MSKLRFLGLLAFSSIIVPGYITAQTFTLSPSSLSFSSNQNDAPSSQSVSLSLQGGGTFTYSTSTDVSWLSASPGGKVISQATITVTESPSGLNPGTYLGHVNVSPGGSVSVSLSVSGSAPPTYTLSPTALNFSANQNDAPSSQSVSLALQGGGTFTYSTSTDVPWLTASLGGRVFNQSTITVTESPSGLTPGPYSGHVFVSPGGTVNVSLLVVGPSPPSFNVTPSVSGSATTSSPTTLTQQVTLSNSGGASGFTASISGPPGFSIGPTSGTISGGGSTPLTVSFNSTGIAPGTYTAQYTIASTGGATTARGTATETVSGTLVIPPGSLSLSLPNTLSQSFTVSDAGPGALPMPISVVYSSSDNKASVSLTPASSTTASITASVSSGALQAGDSSAGFVVVTCSAPCTNSPQRIPVSISGPSSGSNNPFTLTPVSKTTQTTASGLITLTATLSNTASGTNFTASFPTPPPPGFSLVSPSGVCANVVPGGTMSNPGTTTIQLQFDPTGKAPGVYTATLTADASQCNNGTGFASAAAAVTVQGTLVISAPKNGLSITLPNTSSQSFTISDAGPGALPMAISVTYSTSDNKAVVSVSPTTSTTATVTASVSPGAVQAGDSSNGFVVVTCLAPCTAPTSVNIPIVINGPPASATTTLVVSPPSLNFSYQTGGSSPSAQSLSITSNPSTAFTVQSNSAWLFATPLGGSTSTSSSVSVSIDPSQLPAGNNNPQGYLTISCNTPGACTNGPVSVQVNVSITAPVTSGTKIISQIADGGAYQTTIVVVNRGPNPSTASLSFFMDTTGGQTAPWALQMVNNFNYGQFQVPPHSAVFMQTQDTAPFAQGYAILNGNSDTEAFAIFKLRVPGRQDQEGTAKATAADSKVFIPFDNTNGNVTSLALVNSGPAQTIQVVLRTVGGGTFNESVMMKANGHISFRTIDQFPEVGGLQGVAEFDTTGVAFSALAFRFNSTGAFSTVPLYSGSSTPSSQTVTIPQIADGGPFVDNGGNYQTTLVLVNTGTTPAGARFSFFQDSNSTEVPWLLALNGQAMASATVAAGSALFLQTPGTAPDLAVGYGSLVLDPNIQAFAIFKLREPGRQDQEGTAEASTPAQEILVPYDNTAGNVTSMALVNGQGDQTVNTTFPNASYAVKLTAFQHMPFRFPDQFAASTSQQGVADFAGGSICAIAFRFNPTGAFTSVPVFPAASQ